MRALTSQAEHEGYLSISATVAADLHSANRFYERNGFKLVRCKTGGQTRNRALNVRVKELDTPDLFSPVFGNANRAASPTIRDPSQPPRYAIDLNVLFDAVRNRPRSAMAGAVFEAGLAHRIRLVATSEFVEELRRTSHDTAIDPILALAKKIPPLPKTDTAELSGYASAFADVVFPERNATQSLTKADRADLRHLAHAASAAIDGFITSDEAILRARDTLLSRFGLDVLGLSEFTQMLDEPSDDPQPYRQSEGFQIESVPPKQLITALQTRGHIGAALLQFQAEHEILQRLVAKDDDGIIGASLLAKAKVSGSPHPLAIFVNEHHPYASTVADFFVGAASRTACASAATLLELAEFTGQPILRRIAFEHGFRSPSGHPSRMIKVAVGEVVTPTTWSAFVRQFRRLTGLELPVEAPSFSGNRGTVELRSTEKKTSTLSLLELETLYSPLILALHGRTAIIAPIEKRYADHLLGADQLSLLPEPEAGFVRTRTYLNTPRAAKIMRPGAAIIFYESKRSGGLGAAIAIARIASVSEIEKASVPEAVRRTAVVRDVGSLSSGATLLASTLDNVMRFRSPVPLDRLRRLSCVGSSNLQTASVIGPTQLSQLVEAGALVGKT